MQSPNWRVMAPEEYPKEPLVVPDAVWQAAPDPRAAPDDKGPRRDGLNTGVATPAAVPSPDEDEDEI